jgi:hypothetical protein
VATGSELYSLGSDPKENKLFLSLLSTSGPQRARHTAPSLRLLVPRSLHQLSTHTVIHVLVSASRYHGIPSMTGYQYVHRNHPTLKCVFRNVPIYSAIYIIILHDTYIMTHINMYEDLYCSHKTQ